MQKGCESLGCSMVPVALGLAGIWGAVAAWLPPGHLMKGGGVLVTVFGTILGTGIAIVGYLAVENWRVLSGLSRARRGEIPADGKRASFLGTLEPRADEVLYAPFSGRQAAAYEYSIDRREERWDPSKNRKAHVTVTAFEGAAMVPCELRTEAGKISLLGRPVFVGAFDLLEGDEAKARAREFVARRFPEPTGPGAEGAVPDGPGDDADRQYEATGGFQEHKRGSALNGSFDVEAWRLHESVHSPGETVCASGVWSSERGGLVSPAGGTEGLLVERGDVAAAASRRRFTLFKLAVVGLFLLLLQAGLVFVVWRGSR